jgi:hypothetical protein
MFRSCNPCRQPAASWWHGDSPLGPPKEKIRSSNPLPAEPRSTQLALRLLGYFYTSAIDPRIYPRPRRSRWPISRPGGVSKQYVRDDMNPTNRRARVPGFRLGMKPRTHLAI